SQGVRMLVAGDEMGRTQLGNNNAYAQDNELSWVHWDLDHQRRDLLEFTRHCLRILRDNPVLRRRAFFKGRSLSEDGGVKDVTWLRADGAEMGDGDWGRAEERVLGMLLPGRATGEVSGRGVPVFGDPLLLLLNGGSRSRLFALPRFDGGLWEEIVNTARPVGS